jgi:hypothetical protein
LHLITVFTAFTGRTSLAYNTVGDNTATLTGDISLLKELCVLAEATLHIGSKPVISHALKTLSLVIATFAVGYMLVTVLAE